MGEIENRMDRTEVLMEQLAGHMVRFAEGMAELREAQQHTDERLGILVKMFDEWIRGNPRNGGNPISPATG